MSACAGTDSSGELALAVTSGPVTQGTRLQGTRLQGTRLQGTKLQGTRLQGTRLQGTHLDGTTLVGHALVMPAPDPSLEACAAPASGLGRPCGWGVGGIGTCTPGARVTVGAAATCGLGSCAGDSLLRVCTGRAACGPGSSAQIGANDDACGSTCSAVTFVCPTSGSYTVLTANQSSLSTADIAPQASSGSFPLTAPLSGAGFIGATLEGIDEAGAPFDIVIGDVETDPADASIFLYTLLARDVDGSWQNLCEPDGEGAAVATFLAGTWDASGAHHDSADLVTVGCTSGVLTKCVRWGYKPWQTVNGKALAAYHQACTRMARADYCGDGTSHTLDGTWIDIWDDVPIQTRDPAPGMRFEASWTPAGAYCLSRERYTLTPLPVLRECPWKLTTPSLADLAAGCLVKLSPEGRGAIRTNNLSYVQRP